MKTQLYTDHKIRQMWETFKSQFAKWNDSKTSEDAGTEEISKCNYVQNYVFLLSYAAPALSQ